MKLHLPLVALLALAPLTAMAPATAFAADLSIEISTAEAHAGFAAKADTIEHVHMHLHHALNCLVGPKGRAFDAKALNPCAGKGNGAIHDTTDAAQKAELKKAVKEAKAGLRATDMATAVKDAKAVAATLAGANK